jgi:hypothetical protein
MICLLKAVDASFLCSFIVNSVTFCIVSSQKNYYLLLIHHQSGYLTIYIHIYYFLLSYLLVEVIIDEVFLSPYQPSYSAKIVSFHFFIEFFTKLYFICHRSSRIIYLLRDCIKLYLRNLILYLSDLLRSEWFLRFYLLKEGFWEIYYS